MRKTIALCAAIAAGTAHAQDSTFTTKRNAVGLEVTGLIPMSYGDMSSPATYPYVLTYRRAIGIGWLRLSVGGNGWSDRSDGDPNSSALIRERSGWWMNSRVGYAVPLVNDRHWMVLAGLDALYGTASSSYRDVWETNEETNMKASSVGFGLGIALDVQYRIGKRIAIGTEFDLQGMRTEMKEDRTYSENPDFDRHVNSLQTSVDAIRAFSLFLHAYF